MEPRAKRLVFFASALASAVLLALIALGPETRQLLLAGLADPVLGLDHFLVLLAVGAWAGRLGDAARWRLPAVFLVGMSLGFLLAAGQSPLPAIEPLIQVLAVVPLFLLVFAVAAGARLPVQEAISTVILLGGCHGYIHSRHTYAYVVEPVSAKILWFSIGTLASAAALLTAGVAVGLTMRRVE